MPSPDSLRAWQAAIQVAVRVRSLIAQFPRRGYADLRDQMIRSAESIGHNIAEGRISIFEAEFIRYLDTAARSAGELSSQLTTAMEYGIVPQREAFNLNGTVICTRRMIESLRDTAAKPDAPPLPPPPRTRAEPAKKPRNAAKRRRGS